MNKHNFGTGRSSLGSCSHAAFWAVWLRAFRGMYPPHCFRTIPASSHRGVKHWQFKCRINTSECLCRENQPEVDSCTDPVIRPPQVSHSVNKCLKEQCRLRWLLSLRHSQSPTAFQALFPPAWAPVATHDEEAKHKSRNN